MPKKLRNVLAILLVLSLFFSGTVFAQVSPALLDPGGGGGSSLTKPIKTAEQLQQSIKQPQLKAYIESQQKAIEENQVSQGSFTGNSFQYIIAEVIAMGSFGSISEDPVDGKAKAISGVIPTTSGIIASLYSSPPATAQSYIAHMMDSVGIVQPAYAQGAGLGFSSLTPVLSAWIVFRNIAYFFFVAIFMVIGFMIMFRQKISGQAVVTAQQAIPSIIIALVAVTFSYAIAGLLIEIMYLAMFLIVGLFGANQEVFINSNIFQIGGAIIGQNTISVGESVNDFVSNALGENLISGVAGLASGLLLMLVFVVVIFISIFRILLTLLKRYISIIASVILAPVILMMGAIPGQNTFGPWLKGIVGNLSVFPTLLIALVISDTLTRNFSEPGLRTGLPFESGGFVPPYLPSNSIAGNISFLIGLGILIVLPDLLEKVPQLLGAGKGPLDEFLAAAKKNIRAGEVGIPAATGLLGAGAGAIQSAMAINREGIRGRDRLRVLARGYEGIDEDGNKKIFGGVLRQAGGGINIGQKVRKTVDDIQDNRFMDPNNIYRQMDELLKAQGKPASKQETRQDTAQSKT